MLRLFTVIAAVLVSACGNESIDDIDPRSGVQKLPSPARGVSAQVHLARDSSGGVIMSWLEEIGGEQVALMHAALEGSAWQVPVEVARGNDWFVNWADFPSVVELQAGVRAAHWLRRTADSPYAYDVMLSLSSDGGRSWSSPFSPHDDRTPTEHGFVSLYEFEGELGVVWLDGRELAREDRPDPSMTLRAARYKIDGTRVAAALIDERVCECCQTDVTSDGATAFAVYRDRSLSEVRDIAMAVGGVTGWTHGNTIAADKWRIDACPVNGPAIAANGDTLAVAWFTGADDSPRIRLARSSDRGRSFAAASLSEAMQPLGRLDTEVLNDGRIVVSWLERRDGQSAELRLQAFDKHGRTSAVHVIAVVPDAYLSGFPQMVRRANDLVLAWTTGEDGASSVETALLPIAAL